MTGILFSRTEVPTGSGAVLRDQLLGELRLHLNSDDHDDETRRWLLAALDRLLAFGSGDFMSLEPCSSPPPPKFLEPVAAAFVDPAQLFHKLQRLRDRLAHRMPFAVLANEIRVDLQRMPCQS